MDGLDTAAAQDFCFEREPEDAEVEHQRPIASVGDVVFNTCLGKFRIRRAAAQSVDLRQSSHAGPHPMPQVIMRNQVLVKQAARAHSGYMRSGAYERHITAQDIEELRQLVEIQTPESSPDWSDSRIILSCLRYARSILLVYAHRAELVDLKQLGVQPVAFLLEEDWTRRRQPNCRGDANEQRACRKNEE